MTRFLLIIHFPKPTGLNLCFVKPVFDSLRKKLRGKQITGSTKVEREDEYQEKLSS